MDRGLERLPTSVYLLLVTPVRRLREHVGLTQDLLAQLAGITQQTVSRYETGESSPTLEKLDRLAEAVGLRVIVTFASAEADDAPTRPPARSEGPTSDRDAPPSKTRQPRAELWTI